MKRLHTDEPGRGAGRWPSSPRGLRSWFALRGRSRSWTVCRDCRVVEAVSHFMPIEMRMESGGLHAHFDRRQVIRSRAPSGPHKPPTRKRSKKSALMASVWGKLLTPYQKDTGTRATHARLIFHICDSSQAIHRFPARACIRRPSSRSPGSPTGPHVHRNVRWTVRTLYLEVILHFVTGGMASACARSSAS